MILNGVSEISLIAHLRGLFYRFLEKEEIKPPGMAERTKFHSIEKNSFVAIFILPSSI